MSDVSNSNQYDSDPDEDMIVLPKMKRRPKRIIKDDSSSDDDDDDVPLNKRKATSQITEPVINTPKKIKTNREEIYESPKKVFDLSYRTRPQTSNAIRDMQRRSTAPPLKDNLGIREPKVVISKPMAGPVEKPAKSSSPPLPVFKAPASTSDFKAPLPVKAPVKANTNEFEAPMGPPSSNGFKPPSSDGFKAPSSNGFKTPSSDSFKAPSSDGFKAPSSNDFKAPTMPQNELIASRLSHYISCICQDLDQYNLDKIKTSDSLLTFRPADDLPTLDITVMKKFAMLTSNTIKHYKNLDAIDMEQFGKVMKLMENTVIVATDVDVIDYYAKNPEDNTHSALRMVDLINDGLETCIMIFELLTTCKLDRKFLSRNLITNCLHFIKNQLDYTIYPIIDVSAFEDEAVSLTSNAHQFIALINSSPKYKFLMSTLLPHIVRFFRRAFTLILAEELDDDVLVIVAYISMAPFFHDYSNTKNTVLMMESSSAEDAAFSPYEQLKFHALDILKHIFSRYPKHRRWIFEEILTSLGSLTTMDSVRRYRLRSNQTIHVISALFMQLVQCCSTLNDSAAHKNWYLKWNIRYQKAHKKKNEDQMKMLDDKLIRRASTAWRLGAEASANSASFFLEFLMSKCKARKSDSYSLVEYRQILTQTLQDIMTVLNDPEWPVAELILRVFSRILMTLLEEDHSDQYLKSLAIEWLGIIACQIKVGYNRLSGELKSYTPEWVCELNETLPVRVDINTPLKSIALLDQCRKKVLDYIAEEKLNSNVTQFYLGNFGFVESVVWTKANKGWEVDEKKPLKKLKKDMEEKRNAEKKEREGKEDNEGGEEEEEAETEEIEEEDTTMVDPVNPKSESMEVEEPKWPKDNALLLEETCKFYWLSCLGVEYPFPKSETSFEFPEMTRADYILLTELLASRQTLYTSYSFILNELLTCLDKDAVTYRTKALRAIGKIAAQVPEIMEDSRIRNSIVGRVHDGSPSVRDAAVDVMAKYLARLDTVPVRLYEILSERIMDTAVAVRKRLVKLLRELFFKFTDVDIKIDIASKLILRIGDNEVTISQLSLKATQDILFLPFKEIEKDGNDYFGYSYANSPKHRKRKITDLTCIITGAVSKLDPSVAAQNAALSKIIQKTLDGADEKALLWYDKVFQWIVDSLFDRMIMLEEQDSSTEFIHCLATVYSFTKSSPNLLRESHISMLQPYLSVSGDAEWIKARYVLAIYRDVLPGMKYHDPEFIQTVERMLMRLLSQCPQDLIADGISCLCAVVDTISHRYNILIRMLGSCITKLRQYRQVITDGGLSENHSFTGLLKMLLMSGLLCQNFEFDKRREQEPKEMEALNLVYKGEICTIVFDTLQFFTGELMDDLGEHGMTMRTTALQGLGYFFASYPTYMISSTSTALMDKVFEEGTPELKTQLMHVYQEFLAAEEKRIGKREQENGTAIHTKVIDVDTLLGNTEEYAELGVNGSLMQRYLRKILKCALDDSADLRYSAFEVVSAVIHQGLAHPVLCMPAVVAAETSPDIILRNKAFYLHRYAHDKYGNLLYIQMSEYLKTSYQYQQILHGNHVLGYGKRGGDAKQDALLGMTFSVLRDKKKPRYDFLSALVKPFTFDLKTTTADEIDIGYLRYLAENITTLDLSTTNEVLSMVYIMDRILMTLGADLLAYVHFLKKQGIVMAKKLEDDDGDETEEEIDSDFLLAAKLALAMCILLYMKNILVELYDIPDDEIREFNPNNINRKSRDVTKDLEVNNMIDWSELLYFKNEQLNKSSAADACIRFEYLIMSDTTAVISTDE